MRLASEWKAEEKIRLSLVKPKKKKAVSRVCANQDLASRKIGRNTEFVDSAKHKK
ncbi:MAG TPA: hypothetical protein PKE69_28190 [Pyrinomonadaceae bacterium]|nr:hypothetical protein [Pyrinomonadaceae bacterium]